MKFVHDNLNARLLTTKPHKWLVACLLSPIHALQVQYKRRYHLSFRHARKLFFLDMTLLASTLLLIAASFFWFTYDPTVTDLVSISITPAHNLERLQSGDSVAFDVQYKNNSDVTLLSPTLAFSLPPGFVLDQDGTVQAHDPQSAQVVFSDAPPGGQEVITLTGRLYGMPDESLPIVTTLSYSQEGSGVIEAKVSRFLAFIRESALTVSIEAPDAMFAESTKEVRITLTNTSDTPMPPAHLPLTLSPGVSLEKAHDEGGRVEDVWHVESLSPGTSATLSGLITAPQANQLTLTIAPYITVQEHAIGQAHVMKLISILTPDATIQTSWGGDSSAQPGNVMELTLLVRNGGSDSLENLTLEFELPAGVDGTRMQQITPGSYIGRTLTLTSSHNAGLAQLAAGQKRTITIDVPIGYSQSGVRPTLMLKPALSASIDSFPTERFTVSTQTDPLFIGTDIRVTAHTRYYTKEGDQLGRGPLPPRAGEETKYWVLVNVGNTTSAVNNVSLTMSLAPGVTWTGRSSVSIGAQPQYNALSHSVSWQIKALGPHTSTGIFLELAITPTQQQRGSAPALVSEIQVQAVDTYTQSPISDTAAAVSTMLPEDAIGRAKGELVQ
jgi:hypothetical protein